MVERAILDANGAVAETFGNRDGHVHQPEPLYDAELDRLGDFLEGCKGGKAMNIEELDGFFAALIAGPETVMPSEYFPWSLAARCRTPASSAASTRRTKSSG